MPPLDESAGGICEKHVNDFAKATHLKFNPPYSLEEVVRLFSNKLVHRFELARPHLDKEFPYANEWIDTILTGRNLNRVDLTVKTELVLRLLDAVLATDSLICVNDNSGKTQVIAIDVTANDSKAQSKLNTIQGLREDGQTNGFNPNRNIPEVRKELGIDKHWVLLLDNQNLPSHEWLNEEVFAAANRRAKTVLIDVRTVKVVESEVSEQQVIAQETPGVLTMEQASEIALAAREWLNKYGEPTAAKGLCRENSGWLLEWEADVLIIDHDGQAVLIDLNYLNEQSVPAQDIPILEALRDYIFQQSQQPQQQAQRGDQLEI